MVWLRYPTNARLSLVETRLAPPSRFSLGQSGRSWLDVKKCWAWIMLRSWNYCLNYQSKNSPECKKGKNTFGGVLLTSPIQTFFSWSWCCVCRQVHSELPPSFQEKASQMMTIGGELGRDHYNCGHLKPAISPLHSEVHRPLFPQCPSIKLLPSRLGQQRWGQLARNSVVSALIGWFKVRQLAKNTDLVRPFAKKKLFNTTTTNTVSVHQQKCN